ncbi:DUF2723 domain-containing protein [candidate division CSSED10-310 bacterium]|uniref:DUF2723 domain-containing protein n=1 Tax=candidate division CSSED10-310 bacterium TaxID=2855610 RepID=A0ABV6Z2I8_UNCC1
MVTPHVAGSNLAPEYLRSKRIADLGYCFGILFLAGGAYYFSLLPGVGHSGDTTKFQFVGKILGSPHSTGYPLYLILNYLFVHLFPVGTTAFRANLLSSLFSVGAVVTLYGTLQLLFPERFIAFIASLIFAFSPLFWSQSIIAEVYSLHALMMLLTIMGLVKWYLTASRTYLLLGLGFYALAFGNHLSSILLGPALIFLILATRWRVIFDWKNIASILLFFTFSGLQYGYFFWRTAAPETPYLEMQVSSLSQLIWYLKGAQFQNLMFVFSWSEILKRFLTFCSLFWAQFHILTLVIPLGIITFKKYKLSLFLILYFIFNTIYALNYNIPDFEVYLIPSFLVAAIFLGLGMDYIWDRVFQGKRRNLGLLLGFLPLCFLVLNFAAVSQRHNTGSGQDIRFALQQVNRDALIISPDYHYSVFFWYYLIGENLQETGNIYLLHHFTAKMVKEYVENEQPINLPEQRIHTPTALNVYCFSPQQDYARDIMRHILLKLNDLNLKILKRSDLLFLIRPRLEFADAAVRKNYILQKKLDFSDPAAEKYLDIGWSYAEEWGRWATGTVSQIFFALPQKRAYEMSLTIKSGLHSTSKQAVSIYLNNILLQELELPPGQWKTTKVTLPVESIKGTVETLRFTTSLQQPEISDANRHPFGVKYLKFLPKSD